MARLKSDDIELIHEKYKNRIYAGRESVYLPILSYVLDEIKLTCGEFFTEHSLPSFNTCINVDRLAFLFPNTSDFVLKYDY